MAGVTREQIAACDRKTFGCFCGGTGILFLDVQIAEILVFWNTVGAAPCGRP